MWACNAGSNHQLAAENGTLANRPPASTRPSAIVALYGRPSSGLGHKTPDRICRRKSPGQTLCPVGVDFVIGSNHELWNTEIVH
jgi:hypothetical protein